MVIQCYIWNNRSDESGDFIVYLNPASENIFIQYSEKDIKSSNIALYDVLGNKVFDQVVDFTKTDKFIINTFDYISGVYFLTIVD